MGIKGKMAKWRRTSAVRIGLIVVLLLLLAFLYFSSERFKWLIIGLMVSLFVALGFEIVGTDVDIKQWIETGSFSEAQVVKTENGYWIMDKNCEVDNMNCDNFTDQAEAQALFEKCGGKEYDVHGLDGDNDKIVCEHLPGAGLFAN